MVALPLSDGLVDPFDLLYCDELRNQSTVSFLSSSSLLLKAAMAFSPDSLSVNEIIPYPFGCPAV